MRNKRLHLFLAYTAISLAMALALLAGATITAWNVLAPLRRLLP